MRGVHLLRLARGIYARFYGTRNGRVDLAVAEGESAAGLSWVMAHAMAAGKRDAQHAAFLSICHNAFLMTQDDEDSEDDEDDGEEEDDDGEEEEEDDGGDEEEETLSEETA
jgi:hypothetical protein